MRIDSQAVRQALSEINPRWKLQGSKTVSRRASILSVGTEARDENRLVLLTHGAADRAFNPDIARDEFRLLEMLAAAGLPVARPLALAEAHEPPFLITTFVSGASRFRADDMPSFCRTLARTLHAIHAVDIAERDLAFLPRLADVAAKEIDCRRADDQIHAALRSAVEGIRWNKNVLLHGDFWPGNLLWHGAELSGILDWEDAMLGDPLADLGKSRLETLWALGYEAMQMVTAEYLALNSSLDTSGLPVWDLFGAARLAHFASFAADAERARRMVAQYEDFVATALSALQK